MKNNIWFGLLLIAVILVSGCVGAPEKEAPSEPTPSTPSIPEIPEQPITPTTGQAASLIPQATEILGTK